MCRDVERETKKFMHAFHSDLISHLHQNTAIPRILTITVIQIVQRTDERIDRSAIHTPPRKEKSVHIPEKAKLHCEQAMRVVMLGPLFMPGYLPIFIFLCIFSSHLRERKRDADRVDDIIQKEHLVVLGTTGALGGADLETVLEAAVHVTQRPEAAAAGGLAPHGLLAPVVCILGKPGFSSTTVHFRHKFCIRTIGVVGRIAYTCGS